MVAMPGGPPDALLIERFDIWRDRNARRKIAMEDMASVRGAAPSEKHEGSIEQIARALRGVSCDAEADVTVLFGRAALAWLMADGDFHLKNMAVLRIAPVGGQEFTSIRFAPTYDAVTTRVFPGLEKNQLAMSRAGKRSPLSFRDLVRAGATMGIGARAARDIVDSLCRRLRAHLEYVDPASGRV